MRFSWLTQLGFDFDAPAATPAAPAIAVARARPAPPPQPVTAPGPVPVIPLPSLWTGNAEPARAIEGSDGADTSRDRPARGRSATRARTAVLFSRLQEFGLRGVDALVLMRTRTVMVSLIGRTLRVHEGYADAPEPVLRAVVTFAMASNKAARSVAKDAILAHDVERAPAVRRAEPAKPGDIAIIAQLRDAHRGLNEEWFGASLTPLPIRLSGRMARRLGHFDPGTRFMPSEIVMSRTHIVKHGWREAMHTLLHEMVHQWQHETGEPVDHGPGFRAKCREVGITAAAKRPITPLERRTEKAKAKRA